MGKFKSGFVALIGRPNVGKSTFMNYVLGRKVSIISPKPQTTRNVIQGIYTTDNEQVIFIDTPGIHKPLHQLGEFMNKGSFQTVKNADVVLYLVEAISDFGSGDEFVLSILKRTNAPCILVFNKIDLVKDKNRLLESVAKFRAAKEFSDVYYISALNGDNVPMLMSSITSFLDEGPMYYPKDQVTDHPENFIICEIIREKVLALTEEEVPHSVAVVLEEKKQDEENENLMDIRATIYVERVSQRKIIIGAKGQMIKKIGTLARKDIVMVLGTKVYLELWVKVEKDWRNKERLLKSFGYKLEN